MAEAEDAPPPILLPCAICARTFMPQSLEKHARICRRAAVKKRKPFDSAKQRIQGTELAEFLPKQEPRRHHDEKGRATSPLWKKTHDDFLRAIREARGEVVNSRKQCTPMSSSGAPTRANEKGTCPTCNRQFGIKAYDRHVAWCKDRVVSVPVSPAVNQAKERLEARMRYRAPTLKNRRTANREKYSPTSAGNQCKASSSVPALVKPKESVSLPNCTRESPSKQKLPVVRRPGQLKESPISSGPMKSRLADRTNKPAEDRNHEHLPKTLCRPPHIPVSLHRGSDVSESSLKSRTSDLVSPNEIALPGSSKGQSDPNERIVRRVPNDEARIQETCATTKTQKSMVSARSRGNPRLNDVAVNDRTLGVTVQPCKIYKDAQKDDQLVTWKQIGRKKNGPRATGSAISCNLPRDLGLLDPDERRHEEGEIDTVMNGNRTERDSLIARNASDGESKVYQLDRPSDRRITWLDDARNLNRTYLIGNSEDIEQPEIFQDTRGLIRYSPRVEFYFQDTREAEVREVDVERPGRDTEVSNEGTGVAERATEELRMTKKGRRRKGRREKEDGGKAGDKRAMKISRRRTEEDRPDGEDEEDIQRTHDATNWGELCAKQRYEADEQIAANEDTTATREMFEEIETPLSSISPDSFDSRGRKSPALGATNVANDAPEIPVMYERSSSSELKVDSTGKHDFPSEEKLGYPRHAEPTFRFDDGSDLVFSNSFVDSNQDYNLYPKDEVCQSYTCRGGMKERFDAGDFPSDKNEETDDDVVDASGDSIIRREIPGRSIGEAEVAAGEGSHERVNSDVDYSGGNAATECNTRGDNDLESSIIVPKDDVVGQPRRCREKVVPDVSSRRHASSSKKRNVRERDSLEAKRTIKGSVNRLRDSTDSLMSSVEFVELASIERPEAEREIIGIIRPSGRNKLPDTLPDIPAEPTEARRTGERSANRMYWERAAKISRSGLISLDPAYRVDYKLTKRNSRVRILPPVPSSPLIRLSSGDGRRNGAVSDEELSSPESYKPQDHSKLSNDSAYSSLNRKYSHHGRSTNDVVGRLDEDATRNGTLSQATRCKMSRFCHECGQRFPENAKFCCECGVKRLAL